MQKNEKNVLISVGPIPARLDSVKFITNRFKGGLALKTANFLALNECNVTVLKWKFTDTSSIENNKDVKVVSVLDVFEYYNYIKEHAKDFDAFIMAAAVANLAPSNPYEDKFPSHLYKVGEKFNIEFEIAPRAIDVVKQINPRCCLIGYKLFDAKTDEELIEIARHTLKDSKANIIFANTPKEAKTRKIALFQDNTTLECNFDEHMFLILKAIRSVYFKTVIDANIYDKIEDWKMNKILMCKEIIKKFSDTLELSHGQKYGTIAIKVSDQGDFVTTSRGHKGEPVYVRKLDTEKCEIVAEGKATLNVPALSTFIKNGFDYVIHRHDTNAVVDVSLTEYTFPGTKHEYEAVSEVLAHGYNSIMQMGHGYLKGFKIEALDWNKYYEVFEDRYAGYPDTIKNMIDNTNLEDWLDVGCNKNTKAKYVLDPYVKVDGAINLTYDNNLGKKFKLITLKNCINYLTNEELNTLFSWLRPGGVLIANSFAKAPQFRLKDGEATYLDGDTVHHYKIESEQKVYYHTFRALDSDRIFDMGFVITPYANNKSVLLTYAKCEE